MTPVPGWIHLFLDVSSPAWADSIEFWSSVTGWSASAPRGEAGQFVTLQPRAGDAWLKLQSVDDGPRIHLDLDSADRSGAVKRSIELGARPAWRYGDVEVMRSPGGFLFCHTRERRPLRFARTDADSVLDQVCLDIPAPLWDEEVAFWHKVTGRELESGRRAEFAFLGDPDPHGAIRLLLQRLDSTASTDGRVVGVQAHPDFAVAHRAEETSRHVALGARVVNVRDRWTVMCAPDQQVYCLTDRDPATGRVRT